MATKQSTKAPEKVNHPAHYRGTICPNCSEEIVDVADVIDQWTKDPHLWQVLKYVARAGKKDPATEIEDLQKAQWYLGRAIARRHPGVRR